MILHFSHIPTKCCCNKLVTLLAIERGEASQAFDYICASNTKFDFKDRPAFFPTCIKVIVSSVTMLAL